MLQSNEKDGTLSHIATKICTLKFKNKAGLPARQR